MAALLLAVFSPAGGSAQDEMEDFSGDLAEMPELSASIPDRLREEPLPGAPNRWNLRQSVMEAAQAEMRQLESKIADAPRTAARLQAQYVELVQQYQALSAKYAQLSQEYARGAYRIRELESAGQALQIQGGQVLAALQQAQMACQYGNPQACFQAQNLNNQYQAMLSRYQQLATTYNGLLIQLNQIAESGSRLQLAGATVERNVQDTVSAYRQLALDAQRWVARYQQLQMDVASAVADAENPGVDYSQAATQLKSRGELSSLSLDSVAKGLKAGLGAGKITKAELAKFKVGDVAKIVDDVAGVARKTEQVLREVGLLK